MSKTIDAIIANIPSAKPLRWHQRVAPKHVETLREIHAAHRAGKFGPRRKPAAIAIARWLNENRISNVGFQGVLDWLARD